MLRTLAEVRIEMSRIYRLARREEMPIEVAKGLVSILREIGALLVAGDLEKRIEQLEAGEIPEPRRQAGLPSAHRGLRSVK